MPSDVDPGLQDARRHLELHRVLLRVMTSSREPDQALPLTATTKVLMQMKLRKGYPGLGAPLPVTDERSQPNEGR